MGFFLIVGPSGSGKTSIANKLIKGGIPKIVTHTTRELRKGERNGVDYYFVSEKDFKNIDMVEYIEYAGAFYGTSRKEIEDKIKNYKSVINVVADKKAIEFYRKEYGAKVIYLNISKTQMKKRMYRRGDSIKNIKKRLNSYDCLENIKADYIIVNKKFNKTLKAIKKIIEA